MTVSVCIPTFNSARYVRECIDSVLAQTFTDFELIISDDASTDSTCNIIRDYSDPRIRVHCRPQNSGISSNLNNAVRLARGKYVKLLCYDDSIAPTCLEKQVAMLDQNAKLVMVTSGLRHINAEGGTLKKVCWCPQETILRDVDVVAGNMVYGNVIGIPSATLIRRDALLKAGPFSEVYLQMLDVEMYLRLIALGAVGYLPEPLCANRLHPEAATMRFRRIGVVHRDLRRITETMLGLVSSTLMARRIAWGRVAGSTLMQALAGVRHKHLKWPLAAVWEAFRVDPAFVGLVLFLTFFETGILGLAAGNDRKLRIRFGRTLQGRA